MISNHLCRDEMTEDLRHSLDLLMIIQGEEFKYFNVISLLSVAF